MYRKAPCSDPLSSSPIRKTEDVGSVFNQHGVRHHLYADDKQVYIDVPLQDIATARSILTNCIHDITNWCSSRRLQLNGAKTELIWFGSRHTLQNVNHEDLKLQLGSTVIEPARVVRDLGVLLDDELSMKQHITKVAYTCFYQLRRLRQLRCILCQEVTAQSVSAFIMSRVDYCNSVLAGLPHTTLEPLQRVQNAAARLVLDLNLCDHVKPGCTGCQSNTEFSLSCVYLCIMYSTLWYNLLLINFSLCTFSVLTSF